MPAGPEVGSVHQPLPKNALNTPGIYGIIAAERSLSRNGVCRGVTGRPVPKVLYTQGGGRPVSTVLCRRLPLRADGVPIRAVVVYGRLSFRKAGRRRKQMDKGSGRVSDLRYLQLLARQYPNTRAASSETSISRRSSTCPRAPSISCPTYTGSTRRFYISSTARRARCGKNATSSLKTR